MSAMKRELARLPSQHTDGSLMYPGSYVLTWVRVASVWMLVSMEPVE